MGGGAGEAHGEEAMLIPLAKAYLCQSCDAVIDCGTICEGCAGTNHIVSLAGVLNRQERDQGRMLGEDGRGIAEGARAQLWPAQDSRQRWR